MGDGLPSLAAQGPDGVSQLHDAVAATDVMQFRDTPVLHVLGLTGATVQVVDGHHRAFGGSNEAADLGHQRIQVSGVLRQATAQDG